MRLLGVDFGTVRVGLAISDADGKIASPLSVYERRNERLDSRYFQELTQGERITALVVGLPVRTTGLEDRKAGEARSYGQWLQQVTGLPVMFWDERFTTADAEQLLQQAGLTSKRRKARLDMVAAQLMLQSYLDAGRPDRADIRGLEEE